MRKSGPTFTAAKGQRRNNEIPVELSKIIDRKGLDFPLQANDIFYIPEDKERKLTASIIERIIGFGTATGTGILVWHYGNCESERSKASIR